MRVQDALGLGRVQCSCFALGFCVKKNRRLLFELAAVAFLQSAPEGVEDLEEDSPASKDVVQNQVKCTILAFIFGVVFNFKLAISESRSCC